MKMKVSNKGPSRGSAPCGPPSAEAKEIVSIIFCCHVKKDPIFFFSLLCTWFSCPVIPAVQHVRVVLLIFTYISPYNNKKSKLLHLISQFFSPLPSHEITWGALWHMWPPASQIRWRRNISLPNPSTSENEWRLTVIKLHISQLHSSRLPGFAPAGILNRDTSVPTWAPRTSCCRAFVLDWKGGMLQWTHEQAGSLGRKKDGLFEWCWMLYFGHTQQERCTKRGQQMWALICCRFCKRFSLKNNHMQQFVEYSHSYFLEYG